MVTSRRGPEPRVGRVAVEVAETCDNRCLFCCREGLAEGDEGEHELGPLAARLAAARELADEVTLVGGEPTLLGDALVDAVARARALGFRRVGLQSHGRHLGEATGAGLLRRLVDAGLTDVQLSIHGDGAAVHEHHVGVVGAWDEVTRVLTALRGHRVQVAVVTVLTRSNFRNLQRLPEWLRTRGVDAWGIVVPRAAGGARWRFEQVIPRLGMAMPHALRALDAGRRRRLPTWIIGAPECLLGPYRRWSLAEAEPRSYAPACAGCPARTSCPGIDPVYLARFGGAELSSARLAALPPQGSQGPGEEALRRLFVGMGRFASGGRSLATIVEPPRSGAAPQRSAEP